MNERGWISSACALCVVALLLGAGCGETTIRERAPAPVPPATPSAEATPEGAPPTPPGSEESAPDDGVQLELTFSEGCADFDHSGPVAFVRPWRTSSGMPDGIRIAWGRSSALTIGVEDAQDGADQVLDRESAHCVELGYADHDFRNRRSASGTLRVIEWEPREGRAEIVFDHVRIGRVAGMPMPECEINGRLRTERRVEAP